MDVWQLAISQLKCNVDFDLSCRVIEAQSAGGRDKRWGRRDAVAVGFFIAVIDT